jgi:DeoR/GlpR family transcriptional regulator of sugar metabolism
MPLPLSPPDPSLTNNLQRDTIQTTKFNNYSTKTCNPMTTFERRQQLLNLLQAQSGLRVPEIAETLGVSEGTVRNDLNALEAEGLLERVHGGARLLEDLAAHTPAFAARLQTQREAKQAIAQKAVEFVQDGDSLLLDASSTVYALCAHLRQRKGLTIFTNGIETGRELAKNTANTVILLGGTLRSDGMTINVPLNEDMLAGLHFKTAFVSCSGFSLDAGMTEVDIHEAQLKRKMITRASKVVALIDSSKFGQVDLTTFANLGQIHHLLTDGGLDAAWQARLREAGVQIMRCVQG